MAHMATIAILVLGVGWFQTCSFLWAHIHVNQKNLGSLRFFCSELPLRGEILFKFPDDNNIINMSIEDRAARVEAKWATQLNRWFCRMTGTVQFEKPNDGKQRYSKYPSGSSGWFPLDTVYVWLLSGTCSWNFFSFVFFHWSGRFGCSMCN